jgi:hypothetical protein
VGAWRRRWRAGGSASPPSYDLDLPSWSPKVVRLLGASGIALLDLPIEPKIVRAKVEDNLLKEANNTTVTLTRQSI